MTNEKIMELKTVLEDEAFGEEVKNIDTAEGFQKVFAAHGYELSLEEVDDLMKTIADASKSASAELNEAQLENVAGGFGLAVAGVYVAGCVIAYGVGYAAGKYLNKKTGACIY